MCNTFSLSLNSDTTLWAWLNKSWKYEALMLKSLPRSTSLRKKDCPNACYNTKLLKTVPVAESKSWWFGLDELPSTQLLFLSVRVNAIWTLKRNFGAGSINALLLFSRILIITKYHKINQSICLLLFQSNNCCGPSAGSSTPTATNKPSSP